MRLDWRTAAKALAGFLAGLAVWAYLSAPYHSLLAGGAERTMRLFERPDITRLNADGDYISVDRIDFSPRSKHPAIPAHDLTFNFLILTALFAMERRPFADRNMLGFVLASLALMVTHVLAVITEVMSIYVGKLGAWSFAHYGVVARNFWGVANACYRTVLMYAIAFGLWWIFRPKGDAQNTASRRASTSTPRRRRSRGPGR